MYENWARCTKTGQFRSFGKNGIILNVRRSSGQSFYILTKVYELKCTKTGQHFVALLFCERHGKFISHNASFKMPTERPIKMNETGKHSAFRGTICNKDYTMRRVFLSTVLRANDIFLVNISR